ncbi:hypothetical protein OG241_02685 [Streptomyces sp. NBC_01390]
MEAQLTDPSITAVRSAPDQVLARTTELADAMDSLAGRLLERAHAAGAVRGMVTWDDLRPLMCGIAYAAQIHADDLETRLDSGRRYLDAMLHGIHTWSTRASVDDRKRAAEGRASSPARPAVSSHRLAS